jgi:DNA-binding NarL/FixJ family response regulator
MALRQRLRHAQIECVILTASVPEAAFLKNICSVVGIRVHHAATLEDADFLLMATGSAVLLSDVIAVDCSWQSALGMLWDRHSRVKMLVVADPSEAPLLRDIDAPAFSGFIWRPIEFNTVVQGIRAAHQASLDHRKVLDARSGIDASLPPGAGIW